MSSEHREIGPIKRLFLLTAAWCFDFCLIKIAYLAIFLSNTRSFGILCPYGLPNDIQLLILAKIFPSALGLVTTMAIYLRFRSSPGRYLAGLTPNGSTNRILRVLKTTIVALAVPFLFVMQLGALVIATNSLTNVKEKLDSPSEEVLTASLEPEIALKSWQSILNPDKCQKQTYSILATKNLAEGHKLTTEDLEQNKTFFAPPGIGFYSLEYLLGRNLATPVIKDQSLVLDDVLITGNEYKQRQSKYLTLVGETIEEQLQLLENQSASPSAICTRAMLLLRSGNIIEATKLVEANIDVLKQDENLTRDLYILEREMGDYAKAQASCKKLNEAEPWLADWKIELATLCYSHKNYEEALKYLNEAQRTLPFILGDILGTTAPIHRFKAQCLKQSGNQTTSIEEERLALAENKKFLAYLNSQELSTPDRSKKIETIQDILARFNPGKLQGKAIEPYVYAPEARELISQFENRHPSATEIERVLSKSLQEQFDKLYAVKRRFDYNAAVPVKPLPVQQRELEKLSEEIAKAW